MKYKFIYFDLDDTLLDHKKAEQLALKDVHSQFKIFREVKTQDLIDFYQDVNSRQWQLYSSKEVTREQLQRNRFELTLQKLDLDDSRYKEIGSFYLQQYRDNWNWVEGAREVYEEISNTQSVGILTNGFADTQRIKFEEFGFYNSAEHLVISEDVGHLKPDPRVFDHATSLTGFNPQDILYVGDSYSSDIIGASGFGWKTAWFTTDVSRQQNGIADFVFNDFNDLLNLIDLGSL